MSETVANWQFKTSDARMKLASEVIAPCTLNISSNTLHYLLSLILRELSASLRVEFPHSNKTVP